MKRDVSRHHADGRLERAFRPRGQSSSVVLEVVGEQAHDAEEHGLHRQQRDLFPLHLSGQKLLKCRPVRWKRLLLDFLQLFPERRSIEIESKRVE